MLGPLPIRVMIVDDLRVVHSGLRFSLPAFDNLKLVAEVDSSAHPGPTDGAGVRFTLETSESCTIWKGEVK